MERLSLRELRWRNLEGDSFTGDPEGYAKEGSGDRHLHVGPCWGTWKGTHLPGT